MRYASTTVQVRANPWGSDQSNASKWALTRSQSQCSIFAENTDPTQYHHCSANWDHFSVTIMAKNLNLYQNRVIEMPSSIRLDDGGHPCTAEFRNMMLEDHCRSGNKLLIHEKKLSSSPERVYDTETNCPRSISFSTGRSCVGIRRSLII